MADVKDYPPYLDYPKERKKLTNGDKIRQKSDEELSYIIVCPHQVCNNAKMECVPCIRDWLKQEVEGDA